MARTGLSTQSMLFGSRALVWSCHLLFHLESGGRPHIPHRWPEESGEWYLVKVGMPHRMVNWLLSCLVCDFPAVCTIVCWRECSRWGEGHSCISLLPLSEEVPFSVDGHPRPSIIECLGEELNVRPLSLTSVADLRQGLVDSRWDRSCLRPEWPLIPGPSAAMMGLLPFVLLFF